MNRVTIEPTEFKNIRTGHKTYGVRVYDGYDQAYDNTWDKIPKNNIDVLGKVLQSQDDTIGSMLGFVSENKTGIEIGDEYYEWEKIKDCFQ